MLRYRSEDMLRKQTVLIPTVELIRLGAVNRALESRAIGRARAGIVVAVCRALQARSIEIILPQVNYQGVVGAFRIGWIADGASTSGGGPIVVSAGAQRC